MIHLVIVVLLCLLCLTLVYNRLDQDRFLKQGSGGSRIHVDLKQGTISMISGVDSTIRQRPVPERDSKKLRWSGKLNYKESKPQPSLPRLGLDLNTLQRMGSQPAPDVTTDKDREIVDLASQCERRDQVKCKQLISKCTSEDTDYNKMCRGNWYVNNVLFDNKMP